MIPSPITDYGSLTDAADEGEAVNEKNAWAAQWMPIETAPKDGKFVLLWKRAPYSAADILRWESSISAWVPPYWDTRDEGFCGSLVPTHWMPLPPSPEEAEAAPEKIEGYPSDWVRLVLAVSPSGIYHAIGGETAPKRHPGDEDRFYGMERLEKRLKRIREDAEAAGTAGGERQVRLLTAEECDAVMEMTARDTYADYTNVQRKFCEVNGLASPSSAQGEQK